ncbi:hypothetical protein D3C72_2209830 [compost metagenome]
MAIADAQGLMDHAPRLFGLQHPGAEAQQGNLHARGDDGRLVGIGHGWLRAVRERSI